MFEKFLLTRLLRGATDSSIKTSFNVGISTHAPLTRRDAHVPAGFKPFLISTHAPLTRRDESGGVFQSSLKDFYSRASYEARHSIWSVSYGAITFLLTRLLRGATSRSKMRHSVDRISTHAPLTRRDEILVSKPLINDISTHAPLTRRDRYI